jgi:hypothetical protein
VKAESPATWPDCDLSEPVTKVTEDRNPEDRGSRTLNVLRLKPNIKMAGLEQGGLRNLASSVSVQRNVPHFSVFCNKAFMPAYIPMLDVSIVAALIKRVETVRIQHAACSVC